jgi:hypothetical protein
MWEFEEYERFKMFLSNKLSATIKDW